MIKTELRMSSGRALTQSVSQSGRSIDLYCSILANGLAIPTLDAGAGHACI